MARERCRHQPALSTGDRQKKSSQLRRWGPGASHPGSRGAEGKSLGSGAASRGLTPQLCGCSLVAFPF